MISDTELSQIRGGTKWIILGGIAAAITFIIGVIDGYRRTLACTE